MAKRAVVLVSGGLDSAVCLALALERGFDLIALSVRYGQRHALELECARELCLHMGVSRHEILDLDLRAFGGSALTSDIEVPKCQPGQGIPVTYVPARNTIFLSLALALAEVSEAQSIVAGMNAVDYSGYPDCRPEYVAAYEQMANLATKAGVSGHKLTIWTPLMSMSKSDIIREGLRLGVDFGRTTSCYDPDARGCPCQECESCRIRGAAFSEVGLADPRLERFGL